jgi:hypothetical protein
MNYHSLFYINLYNYHRLFLLTNNNMDNIIYESRFLKMHNLFHFPFYLFSHSFFLFTFFVSFFLFPSSFFISTRFSSPRCRGIILSPPLSSSSCDDNTRCEQEHRSGYRPVTRAAAPMQVRTGNVGQRLGHGEVARLYDCIGRGRTRRCGGRRGSARWSSHMI